MSEGLAGHFARMARNNRWANHRLHKAVGQLAPGEFEAERTGFFPSIAGTLNHILEVDRYYVDALDEAGEGLRVFDAPPIRDRALLTAAQVEVDRRLIACCDRLEEAALDRRVATDRGEDGIVQERIGDVLAHLFQHQIHHRGQVHAMLSGTSVRPPQLDEFFLDYDRGDDIAEVLGEANA